MSRSRILLSLVLACPLAAVATPATYQLDPVHTRVLFLVGHAGFSQAMGTVSGSTGTLTFDPQDWSSATLSVSIPMSRMDLGDAGWNRAADGLVDGHQFPTATFVSSTIQAHDATHASVCGALTLHGTPRPLCLQVTFNQLKRAPVPPFRRTAGFSATATLSRKAFGIDGWPTVIGDAVDLRIEAEAEAVRGASEMPAPSSPTPTAPTPPRTSP